MSAVTRRRKAAKRARKTAENEPVAVAGAVRTLLYVLLSPHVDVRTLSEIVVVAETVVGIFVRQFVSPVRPVRRPRRRASAQAQVGNPQLQAVS